MNDPRVLFGLALALSAGCRGDDNAESQSDGSTSTAGPASDSGSTTTPGPTPGVTSASGSNTAPLTGGSESTDGDSGSESVGGTPDPSGNWESRSTAPGVTMATNFPHADDVFDFVQDDPSNYAWDEENNLSGGGALRIVIRDSDGTSGWDWWRFLDDTQEPFGSAESGLRDEYWMTYSVFLPDDYYDWVFRCAGSRKFSITSSHPQNTVDPISRDAVSFSPERSGSSVVNEIVIDDTNQTMWPTVYRQGAGFSAQSLNAFGGDGCDGSDVYWMNTVDDGAQAGTRPAFAGDQRSQACLDWNAQYGPSYRYGSQNGGLTQGMRRDDASQTPHPDPVAAGPHFEAGWNSIMVHIRFPTTWAGTEGSLLEISMHHPGDDGWTLVAARTDDFPMNDPSELDNGIPQNGGIDGYFHWGLWLTPYRTGGESEAGIRPNTYLVYDEVIVSTEPIAAPG